MALIHVATLTPPKLVLLADWLPTRPWFTETGASELRQVGSYRFDDPAGEVGIEALLVQAGDGPVLHVPLSYRAAPLDGAEQLLVGTSEHSVLGTRWVYDGCGDPVVISALVTAVLTGGTQAEEYVDRDGRLEPRQPTATVAGSGTPGTLVPEFTAVCCHDEGATTVIRAGDVEVVVARVVGAEMAVAHVLTGRWANSGQARLAGIRSFGPDGVQLREPV